MDRLKVLGSLPFNFVHPSTHKMARDLQSKMFCGSEPVMPLQPDRASDRSCWRALKDSGKSPDREVQPHMSMSVIKPQSPIEGGIIPVRFLHCDNSSCLSRGQHVPKVNGNSNSRWTAPERSRTSRTGQQVNRLGGSCPCKWYFLRPRSSFTLLILFFPHWKNVLSSPSHLTKGFPADPEMDTDCTMTPVFECEVKAQTGIRLRAEQG